MPAFFIFNTKNMAKYFTIEEMTHSDTAVAMGISNTPTTEHLANLQRLMEVLDGLREAWSSAIRVTSGYRSQALNDAIPGSSGTSVHRFGLAADMQPENGQITAFWDCCKKYFAGKGFDQLLFEENRKTGVKWVHFGLSLSDGTQRRQVKALFV